MKLKFIIALALSVLCSFAYAQSAKLIPAMKIRLTGWSSYSDPYIVTGITQDITSNWNASDIMTGDSLYIEDGNELRIYSVTSIVSAVGVNFTIVIDDMNDVGSLPPLAEGALFRTTPTKYFTSFVGGISESLQTMIDNRFAQRLDAILASAAADGVISGMSYSGDTITVVRTIGANIKMPIAANHIKLNPVIDLNKDGANETTVQEGFTAVKMWGIYKNDTEAASAGVPLKGFYIASSDNTLGLKAGTLTSRAQ